MRLALHLFVPALVVVACAAPAPAPPAHPLAGTAWRLHAIQSMDDAQGTTRVPVPDHFTLRFDPPGTASIRLDCNRGTGSWEARAAGDGTGTLRFGPIAATQALCGPPHLDERVARDLPYVRGYLLRDGKLFLSLMADAGIYEWHPLNP
jgi:heat shock protein HslJ